MRKDIGLIELKSTPMGILTADEMLKAADIELILSTPICPGKYVIIISGNVGAVKSAVNTGKNVAGLFLIDSYIITNVHEKVFPALSGLSAANELKSVGAIETMSAISSVKAGDTAVKASNVDLIEIRIARGLGGKSFMILSGDVSSVKTAIDACKAELEESGELISAVVIPSPHKDLQKYLI